MLEDLSAVIGGDGRVRGGVRGRERGGGDREDLSGPGRPVKIAPRPLCNKGWKFKPIFSRLVANNSSALALITETLQLFFLRRQVRVFEHLSGKFKLLSTRAHGSETKGGKTTLGG